MARQLRSDVRQVKNIPLYKLIIATDKLIGDTCKNSKIDVIAVKDGSLEEVEEAVEARLKENTLLKPGVVISAGNKNITLKYWGSNPGLISGREGAIKHQLIEGVIEEMKEFQERIQERGGFVIFTSLVPKAKDQISDNDSTKTKIAKRLMNEVFKEVNTRICKINEEAGQSTPNIKTYLQKTGKKEKGKVTLTTIRSRFLSPEKEVPRRKEQEMMMDCCAKALVHAVEKHARKNQSTTTAQIYR